MSLDVHSEFFFPLSAGSGAVRRFGLNQTSWISLRSWKGERKSLGDGRVARVLSAVLLRSILPTTFPACLFSF